VNHQGIYIGFLIEKDICTNEKKNTDFSGYFAAGILHAK
jgi:hypothetical protein